jgi:hypothetical protein
MALVIVDAESFADHLLKIDAPPAHDTIGRKVRSRLHDPGKLGLLRRRQARLGTSIPGIMETIRAGRVEAMHLVSQCLPIHAADPGRIGPAHPVHNRSQRQQTPALVHIVTSLRKPPKLRRRIVRP